MPETVTAPKRARPAAPAPKRARQDGAGVGAKPAPRRRATASVAAKVKPAPEAGQTAGTTAASAPAKVRSTPKPATKTPGKPPRKRATKAATPAARRDRRGARPRNREQTIHDILEAAEALLDRKGPDGFGLAELGRDAGVSFGLIHHYFGGKEALLRTVLRRNLRAIGREIRRTQETGEFWAPEAPAVALLFDALLGKPGFARLMAWGLLTGLLGVEEVSLEVQRDRRALDVMVGKLRDGIPGASSMDAAALTTLLMSAVLGFSLIRPLLVDTRGWNDRSDATLRGQLVRAMTTLARPRPPRD